jgi:hypothetical protein
MTEDELRAAILSNDFAPIYHHPETTITHEEGDITWYLGRLDDGRWWAYDDAEPMDPDRLVFFDTKAEAQQFDADGWIESHPR